MGGATKLLMLLSTPFPLLSPRPAALRLRLRLRLLRPFSSSASSPYPSADAAAAASFPPNPDPAPSYAPNPGPISRAPGQHQTIQMKQGDWICHKCSFMNFARNTNCRECNEGRPQRQLTGAEWECPQCDFFNYGKNVSCLRCDCKRPGEAPVAGAVLDAGYGGKSNFEQILDRGYTDKSAIERKLAANDEKAERWFSKVSQLDDASDLSNAAADEDFPEIMPLRKGENRFVVSTRKTPLERRLANSQYESNMGNDGAADGYGPRSESFSGTGSDKMTDSSVSQSLDRILGRSPSSSAAGHANTGAGTRINSSENRQRLPNERKDPDYVPFVPLPADMFSKSKNSDGDMRQAPEEEYPSSLKAGQLGNSASRISGSPTESKVASESADASERWSKKVSETDNIADISDEDFPDIMPMRKGENRFVVSKKKDRSLTSPQYKRRLAMEQANSSNFVPFVPFPPDYFAKKDKQPEAGSSTTQAATGDSTPAEQVHGFTEKPGETKSIDYNQRSVASTPQNPERQMVNNEFNRNGSKDGRMDTSYGVPATNEVRPSNNTLSPGNGFNDGRRGATYRGPTTNPYQPSNNSTNYNNNSWSSGTEQKNSTYSGSTAPGNPPPAPYSQNAPTTNPYQPSNNSTSYNNNSWTSGTEPRNSTYSGSTAPATPPPAQYSQNAGESWKYSGKSLEGSAVKETDPLDMSEEAKTERWFKRVANIKDISELSQIPDSDFPEIMPMRKGVNRFVVSKRKTPLERRLTSPQYRRNLPTVSSDPEKDNK